MPVVAQLCQAIDLTMTRMLLGRVASSCLFRCEENGISAVYLLGKVHLHRMQYATLMP